MSRASDATLAAASSCACRLDDATHLAGRAAPASKPPLTGPPACGGSVPPRTRGRFGPSVATIRSDAFAFITSVRHRARRPPSYVGTRHPRCRQSFGKSAGREPREPILSARSASPLPLRYKQRSSSDEAAKRAPSWRVDHPAHSSCRVRTADGSQCTTRHAALSCYNTLRRGWTVSLTALVAHTRSPSLARHALPDIGCRACHLQLRCLDPRPPA